MGYLGEEALLLQVKEFLNEVSFPMVLLDPVFADSGRCYQGITLAYLEALKELLPYTTLITPNLTEACMLTDTPYHDGLFSEGELRKICQSLTALGAKQIILTGLKEGTDCFNYLFEEKSYSRTGNLQRAGTLLRHPLTGASRPGTGDIFASVLGSPYLRGFSLISCVEEASKFVACCVKASEQMGVPVQEGVIFEPLLSLLTTL